MTTARTAAARLLRALAALQPAGSYRPQLARCGNCGPFVASIDQAFALDFLQRRLR